METNGKQQMVQLSVEALEKMVDNAVEKKLHEAQKNIPTDTISSPSASSSAGTEVHSKPGLHPEKGRSRKLSIPGIHQSSEVEDNGSPRNAHALDEDYGTFDCDPRMWILAAGRLEKKRDGNWREGWGKRFFVLTETSLHYFLLPKRAPKGDLSSLLGDERGQIKLLEITGVSREYEPEGNCNILVQCDTKRGNFSQSTKSKVVLRARTRELGEKWYVILAKTVERVRSGGGQRIENYLTPNEMNEIGSSADDTTYSRPRTDSTNMMNFIGNVASKVIPQIDECVRDCRTTPAKVSLPDPILLFAVLVAINGVCFTGMPVNSPYIWLGANAVFLMVIVQQKSVVQEHEQFTSKCQRLWTTLHARLADIRTNLIFTDAKPRLTSVESTTEADAGSKLPRGGETMSYAKSEENKQDSWSEGDPSIYSVRDVAYAQAKKKVTSGEALYDCVGMDLLTSDSKICGINEQFALPPPRECDNLEQIGDTGYPRIMIVNFQIPTRGPSPFASGEDPGISLVQYYAIKPATVQAVMAGNPSPQMRLFKRFVSEWRHNEDIRRRFKLIGIAANFEELPLPKKFASFNGKPVILYKAAALSSGPDFIEVTVLVHKFAFVARTVLNQFRHLCPTIEIRTGFVIQGEDDEELPECIVGCSELHHVDFARARQLNTVLDN